MSENTAFTWNGKPLITIGELADAIVSIESREQAQRFMEAYRVHTPYAAQNVGYLAGYFDHETADRIYDWFQTAHPIFGTHHPSAEEAFAAGQRIAKKTYGAVWTTGREGR